MQRGIVGVVFVALVAATFQVVATTAAAADPPVGQSTVSGVDRVTSGVAAKPWWWRFRGDACGKRIFKRAWSWEQWECTFVDNFNGNQLNREKWIPQRNFSTGTNDVYACYADDPRVVQVRNGKLELSVRQIADKIACPHGAADSNILAGQVSTYHRFSQKYGRFEARMRVTESTAGLHEAFWLWPDARHSTINWPYSGEIDIAETYSNHPNLVVPFLHYKADDQGPQPGVNTAYCQAERGKWNTYTLEWGPNRLEIFVNGQSCLVNTSGDPAFQKRYIIMLTQALGKWDNGADLGSTTLPATTEVDYVKAWK